MGKGSFQRDEDARKKRRERRLESGYIPRAHEEEDAKRGKHHRDDETRALHCKNVALFTEYLIEEKYQPPDYKLQRDTPAPDIVCIKDFLRWYINSSAGLGRISKNGKPTVRSTCTFAERFFGGFEDATTSQIVQEDRTEIYAWIRKVLLAEEVIEDIKKQPYNFTRDDFRKIASSLWTCDCPVFLHGLLKIYIFFALQVFLFTGARIGAFVPEHKHRKERGLRYRHIELVLFRSANEPWEVGWRINQQWIKKNRDKKYTVFGIGIRDHNRPQFATGIFLLTIALADGALFGIESVEDLTEFDLRGSGLARIPLRWKEAALDEPVFKNVTAKGPQGIPLIKELFCLFLRHIFSMAGYSKNATIHDIRRALGLKIEGRHGSAPVSQIYGHKSGKTYPEHYQAHCSSIDTVGDVLDEEEETYHIEYFQGYEQFREVGLPLELSAKQKEAILERPELVARRDRIEQLVADQASSADVDYERREYRKSFVSIRLSELARYKADWFEERRKQRILTRGKAEPENLENNPCSRALALIMPELGCIAETLSSAEPLSFEEKLLFAKHLLTQCRRDYDVIFLPNEAPTDDGLCPVDDCRADIQKMEMRKRSPHIHDCVRRDIAQRLAVRKSDLQYCYECMTWCRKTEWRDHCHCHLQSWSDRHCEVIVYRHTVIRPGYCPCCLWNQELPADDRLKYWLYSADLRNHVEENHIGKVEWPTSELICGCSQSFKSERDFRYHLHDVHKLADGIWKSRRVTSKRKRAAKEPACVDEKAQEPKPKEIKFRHYNPPNQCLQTVDSHERSTIIQTQTNFTFCGYPCPPSYSSGVKSSSSASESNTADASASTSPLSSLRTTPDLELIGPRILDPLWSGNGASTSIDKTCGASDPVACADNGDKSIIHEEMTDDLTINHIDALHIDSLDQEGSGTTADTKLMSTSAVPDNVRSSSPDVGPRDGLPERSSLLGCGQKSVSVNSLCETPSTSEGPVTRAMVRAEQRGGDVDKPQPQRIFKRRRLFTVSERRTLQTLKNQNLAWDQVKPHFPQKPVDSLRRAWECTRQHSVRTRSQNKRLN